MIIFFSGAAVFCLRRRWMTSETNWRSTRSWLMRLSLTKMMRDTRQCFLGAFESSSGTWWRTLTPQSQPKLLLCSPVSLCLSLFIHNKNKSNCHIYIHKIFIKSCLQYIYTFYMKIKLVISLNFCQLTKQISLKIVVTYFHNIQISRFNVHF